MKQIGVYGMILVLFFSAFIPSIASQLETRSSQLSEKNQLVNTDDRQRTTVNSPVLNGLLDDVYLTHGTRIYYGNSTYQNASENLYFIDNTTIDANFVWIALVLNPHFVDNTYGNGTVPQYRNVNGDPCGHSFVDLNGSDRQGIKLYDGNSNLVFYAIMDLIHSGSSAPSGYGIPAWESGESVVYVGDSNLVKYNTSTCFNVNYYYNTPPYNVLTDSPTLGDQNYSLYPGYEEWEYRIIYELKVDRSLFDGNATNVLATEVPNIHASPNKIGPHSFAITAMFGSLGDYVWKDVDKDGIQDINEIGFSDVTVILYYYYTGSDTLILGSTTTTSAGYYLFNYLAPGDYYLKFILPEGYRFTLPDQTDDAHDSDANIATGETITISLSPDEDAMTWDAGMYLKEYSLSITIVGTGSVQKNPDQPLYTHGQVVTLTAIPEAGWSFDHWAGDLTGNTNPTTITMTENKSITAYFTQNIYTLTININPTAGGSVTANPNPPYYYGDVVTLTATGNPGYTFSHWSGDATGTSPVTTVTMTGNKTVIAHFTLDVYSLTITINPTAGGSVTANPNPPYHYGDVVTLTATGNPGYTFSHWSGDATGSNPVTTVTMTGNKSVTAHFTQNTYTLTITIEGEGTVTKDPDQSTYTYGQIVTLTANPETGWIFNHWGGDLTGSQNPTTITINDNKQVTANFTITTGYVLNITIDPTGGGIVTTNPNPPYDYGEMVTLTATANLGYTFDYWSGDAAGSNPVTTVTMTGNKSVTAHFTQNVYTLNITIDPTDGGTVEQDPEPPYHYGDVVTLTAISNPGFIFDHWSGDASGSSNVTTVTMDGNKSVTAHFIPIEYTLTVTVDPPASGTVNVDPDPPYYYNDVVTLTAIPNTDYVFDHWSGDASGSSPVTTVIMDDNKIVTAHFVLKQFILTIAIDGEGMVIKDPDQATYTVGTTVELTAFAETGWLFDHWSGDVTGDDNPETIVMSSDKNVTAHFYLDDVTPTVQIVKPEKALYINNNKIRSYILDRKPLIIGKIDIEVNASDTHSGINRVEFFIDDELLGNQTTEPYLFTWSDRAFFRHTIKVIVYDNAENSAFDEIRVWKFF